MKAETMTLPFGAENAPIFAEILQSKKERFVRLCLRWDSARDLCDDLALYAGYEVSERTVHNWRARQFKRVPYAAVQAVKYTIERKKLQEAQRWAETLKEAHDL